MSPTDEMTSAPRVLLASASPQRLQLLQQVLPPEDIQTQASGHQERALPGETPFQRVQRLALEKARAVIDGGGVPASVEVVIGADTEIVLEQPGGRFQRVVHPRTVEEAQQCLRRLSGRQHIAVTGLALLGRHRRTGQQVTARDCVQTRVQFRDLSQPEIDEYARSGEGLGRAGAYAIQHGGQRFVERIEGSYSNVVGLPLERLREILRDEFGIAVNR